MRFKNPPQAATVLTLLTVAFVACTIGAQRFGREKKSESGKTAQIVARLVSEKHISHQPIDDAMSERLLLRYLKSLDPQKLYFSKGDIEERLRYRTQLDDAIKAGNIDFAFESFDLYLRRLEERIDYAQRLIDEPHDLSVDEEMVVDADDIDWAASVGELEERWRKRIKYDLLTLKLDDTELADARTRLHKRYHNVVSAMRQTEEYEKLELYLTALTHCFDPHSSYMSPQTLEDFRISMNLRLEGIGAALRSEDGYTEVAQIVPGGAADEDGRLKVKDKIIGVDSDATGDVVDVVEMKLSKVVRYIRGPKGTRVRLQVKTAETGEVVVYELQRKTIELKSGEVKGEIIDTKDRVGDRSGRVGVINIPLFYRNFQEAQLGLDFKSTRKDVIRVLEDFNRQGGVDAVVVDLRWNGGGALSEAIEVSGLFITEGPVVQVQEPGGRKEHHDDDDPEWYYRGPLVVVCNRMSASASEIFAGAIKDYDRGIIIGDTTTHGKGTVQNVMPVTEGLQLRREPSSDRGALKLTINQFYRVNGDSTQNRGVKSDIVLPSKLDHSDSGEESLDNALPFSRTTAANHIRFSGFRDAALLASLTQQSGQRISQDAEFQKLNESIGRFIARKNRKTISLNEAKLKAELEDAKADAERDKKDEDEALVQDPPIFPDEYYNDEVLNITLDYVDLVKGVQTVRK